MFGMPLILPPPPPPLKRTKNALAAYARDCDRVNWFNRRQWRMQRIGALAFGCLYVIGVPLAAILYLLAFAR